MSSLEAKPPPPPCHVGFVFALSQESGGLVDRLAGAITVRGAKFSIEEGGLAGRAVAVVVSGPGRAAARQATEALITGHKPTCVISAGFAGGLSNDIRAGDIVIASEIVAPNVDPVAIPLPEPPPWKDAARPPHVGRFITVDNLATTPAAKRDLASKYQAIAVDMESQAVAAACHAHGVRFLAVRIVSDAVDDELPPEVNNLVKQPTAAGKLGALAGALFKRPSAIKDLYRLKEDALVNSDKLAAFLEHIMPRV